MARPAKLNPPTPSVPQWSTCIRGKRYKLGTDEKKAKERFEFLLRDDGQLDEVKEANPELGKLFLAWLTEQVKPKHHAGRFRLCRDRLNEFLAFMGEGARIGALRPNHIENWIASKREKESLTPGTERNYKAIILACLNWAAKDKNLGGGGLIPSNPLRGRVKLPEGGARGMEAVWKPETFQQVFKHANPAFVQAVKVLAGTGMRPSLLCRLEAGHYNAKFKRFEVAEITHNRKKAVFVYLTGEALQIVETLVARFPVGKLFRNAIGTPWSADTLQLYLYSMQHKYQDTRELKWQAGLTVKGLRHTFATAFLREKPNETEYLRVILGHKDYKMILAHYGKLVDQGEAIRERLNSFSAF